MSMHDKSTSRSVFELAMTMCLMVLASCAWAQRDMGEIKNVTAGEMSMLPSYCADANGFSSTFAEGRFSDSQRQWFAKMGSTFGHIHHYCWALLNAGRAHNPMAKAAERQILLGRAIGDCNYVVERAPPDFVLLPEIYLRMGQFSFERGDVVAALEYFDRSRAAKSDYWPPYIEIAKVNMKIGRRQEAEAALKQGLEVMPGEPRLKEALDNLKTAPGRSKPAPG
jgi:tetratricopeptide (TPR) repeat protein